MKHILAALLAAACSLVAADKSADPFAGAFFPPELILQSHEQIGMGQQQLEAVQARVKETQSRYEALRKKLEIESTALAALVKQERVEEAAALTQLDKVLDAERELKHLHIGLMVAIKNQLTPEQQAKLRELVKGGGAEVAEATRKRLTEKVELVKTGAQAWAAGGRDPSEILKAMEQQFRPLIESGKVVEAEAELDRLLEQLKPEKK